MKNVRWPVVISTFFWLQTASADWVARIVRVKEPQNRIQEVEFKSNRLKVFQSKDGKPSVKIEGVLKPDDWTLLYQASPLIKTDSTNHDFMFEVSIQEAITIVEFMAIDLLGKVTRERFAVDFKFLAEYKESLTLRRFSLLPSLGLTYLTYRETSQPDLSEAGLTGKVSFIYLLAPEFDFGASAFMTLLPLTRNPSERSARFLGLNVRVGYAPPLVSEPWRLTFMGGLYYTTMLTNGPFGFVGMAGPQLFPMLRRNLLNNQRISFYVKLSPVANNFSVLSIASRELAFGAGWTRLFSNRRSFSLNIDVAELRLALGSIQARTNSYSLSGAYGW